MELFDAFGLSPGSIVAAVGGGGKTSLVYRLAAEASARGLSAVVTTTTKFTKPPGQLMPRIIESSDSRIAGDLGQVLAGGESLVAITGYGDHGRMHGFTPEAVAGIASLQPGMIAIEADGSAHRPFKAPGAHEPAIPACTTDVVVCVGLSVLGHVLEDSWVHRSEVAAALAAAVPGSTVTPSVVVRVLLHPDGGRKGVLPRMRIHALLNNPANTEQQQLAVHIGQRLVYGGFDRAVVAAAHVAGDVRAVIR